MSKADPPSEWQAVADEPFGGRQRWRADDPTPSWAEIEAALDERLAALRVGPKPALPATGADHLTQYHRCSFANDVVTHPSSRRSATTGEQPPP